MFGVDNFIDGRSVQALGNSVRLLLESISAQAQTQWFKQHDRQGGHAAVTATSVASEGLVTFPRFGFRPDPFMYGAGPPRGIVETPDLGLSVVELLDFPHVEQAGVILVNHAGARLHGLTTRGRQIGDVVALVNWPGDLNNLVLRLRGSGGNFAGSLNTPNVDVTLDQGRWVWLILLAVPSASSLRWYVHHF